MQKPGPTKEDRRVLGKPLAEVFESAELIQSGSLEWTERIDIPSVHFYFLPNPCSAYRVSLFSYDENFKNIVLLLLFGLSKNR
jgi:hypothetical protein